MVKILIRQLHEFQNHPYKVIDNSEMKELIKSIQEEGIISPLIVRPSDNCADEYEVISGHRRLYAAKKAGLTEVPVIIHNVSRDEATVMMVDSNLHREHILPSEKAFAYKMRANALKHQGKRTDLTMGQLVPKSDDRRTLNIIGTKTGESYKTIQRYIHLTNLIPELLDMMDNGVIAFSVGYELSFLEESLQYSLLNIILYSGCTPSYSQASRMHKAIQNGLSVCLMEEIMNELKGNQKEFLKIPLEQIQPFVPKSYTIKQVKEFVIKAVEYYYKNMQGR